MKRIISALLAAIIVLCLSAPFVYADNKRYTAIDSDFEGTTDYATREQAVACFIKAVGLERFKTSDTILDRFSDSEKVSFAYREEMSAAVYSGLISGYEDKTLRPQSPITRIEALVILARALSRTELTCWYSISFVDTPDWAKDKVDVLAAAGIVKGYGDGILGARDLLTLEQVNVLCERIVRVTGPMGDFYDFVNTEWIEGAEVNDNMPIYSDSIALESQVSSEISDIIFSLYRRHYYDGEDFEESSPEKKIINIYSAAANQAYRDKIGFDPIKEPLLMIDNATNLTELTDVMAELKKMGFAGIISAALDTNIYDTSEYVVSVLAGYMGIEPMLLDGADKDKNIKNYQKYIKKLFCLAGEENCEEQASAAAEILTALAGGLIEQDGSLAVSETVALCSKEELKTVLQNIDADRYLTALGFDSAKKFMIYDREAVLAADALFKEENIEGLKAYLKAAVLDTSAPYLTAESFAAAQEFNNFVYGTNFDDIPADFSTTITQELLGWELGSMYIDIYFPDNVKTAVVDMTQKILRQYEELIKSCTILTPQTRSRAIAKLRKIKINAAFPDNIEEYFIPDTLRPIEEGGSLMEYKMQISKSYNENAAGLIQSGEASKNDAWHIYPQTVNATYDPVSNSITVPAGILRAPYFESGAEFEENLGGIGTVIAHEITHAFDMVGSQFDEKGNLRDWWTEQDRAAFNNLCSKVIDEYNGIKVAGENINGELTINENMADLAGMSCIISLAGESGLDFDKIFRSYAKVWRTKIMPEYQETMLETDVHSPAKVRVNRVLSNFEEFYNCYGIIEGDGMYIPKEKRINIWD